MNIHQNARLTPLGREHLVRAMLGGETPQAAARAAGVCLATARKWIARYRAEGAAGLQDRSSRPHRLYRPTPTEITTQVEALRRQRFTGKQIAADLGLSPATVSRIKRRLGLNRIRDLEPAEPARRYEREHPGDMIHIDIKKLGRFEKVGHRITGDRKGQSNSCGIGWEFVHVAIECHPPRLLADHARREGRQRHRLSQGRNCLLCQPRHHRRPRHDRQRLLLQSPAFRDACRKLGLKHVRTRPYTPKTNGKAERFIQTALREWAYARAYTSSNHRAHELPIWLHRYNWHRPHGGIKSRIPISRLGLTEDNLLSLHN